MEGSQILTRGDLSELAINSCNFHYLPEGVSLWVEWAVTVAAAWVAVWAVVWVVAVVKTCVLFSTEQYL